jgi:hypothetical protein
MTSPDVTEFLKAILSWPVVFGVAFFYYRKQVPSLITAIEARIKDVRTVKVAGAEVGLDAAQLAVKGEVESKQQEVDAAEAKLESPDTPDAEKAELQRRLESALADIDKLRRVQQALVFTHNRITSERSLPMQGDGSFEYAYHLISHKGELSQGRRSIMEKIAKVAGPDRIIAVEGFNSAQQLESILTEVARNVASGRHPHASGLNQGALTGIRGAGLLKFNGDEPEATIAGAIELYRAALRVMTPDPP